METIKLLELFSGIQSQERAIRQLDIPYESVGVCDCDKDVLVASAAMRFNLEKEISNYDFPSVETMTEELQQKNIGYDFDRQRHTITSRTPLTKLKQYYISDKLLKNLGDISKVERLPRANFVTYSSPCQSFSVAGKLAGAAKTCTKCGHKWDIDFSNPDYNYKCPICGNASLESTTSGLLQEVQRLLSVAYEDNELPEYLMLENVKNLVQKKFIGQFEAWVKWLDSIGYNTYWKVLNGKHYGIPQNRERVFAISIRKDVDTKGFTFPEAIPLTTRLKDILEKSVDEKYYLPDDRIEKILNSTFVQEKKRIQTTDVCDTLLARDYKDPKCVPVEEDASPVRIGNIYDDNFGTGYAGNVWDKDGLSPTLQTAQGGNRMPLVLDEIKVVGNYMPSNHDASRVVDVNGIAPTVKENHGTVTAIAEPHIIKVGQVSSEGSQSGMVYSPDGIAPTLIAGCHGYAMGNIIEEQEPFIVASRGRNPENPSDRTPGAPTEQRLEPNFSGCTNTLTSVQKDNYVCEPQVLRAERTEYGKEIRKQYEAGEIDEKIGNMREMKPRTDGIANTITTVQKDNYVVEPQMEKNLWTETQKQMITDNGNIKRYINSEVVDEFNVGDCADISFPNGYNKANRVFDGYSPAINGTTTQSSFIVKEPIVYDDYNSRVSADQDAINTLTCNCGASAERNGVKIIEKMAIVEDQFPGSRDARIYENYSPTLRQNCNGLEVAKGEVEDSIRWRIRKLTSKECWRLMNFTDSDHDRAAKYVSPSAQYKQAGNSIVVSCLIGLMSSLFIEDGHKAEVWTKYMLDFND